MTKTYSQCDKNVYIFYLFKKLDLFIQVIFLNLNRQKMFISVTALVLRLSTFLQFAVWL